MNQGFKKSVSTLVIFLFAVNTCFADAVSMGVEFSQALERPQLIQIDIPAELASVDEFWEAPARPHPKMILQIQNAHTNYEAQSHIRDLMAYLNKNYGFKTIFVEGASENLNPDYLKLFPDAETNRKLWDELAKRGQITGADWFLLGDQKDAQGIGIENADLYRQNYEALKAVFGREAEINRFVSGLDAELDNLATKTLPPETRKILAEWKKFEKGHREFMPYVENLAKLAKTDLNLDLRGLMAQIEWPQLTRILVLQGMEKKLQAKRSSAEAERQAMIIWLKQNGIRKELIEGLERFDEKHLNMNRIRASSAKIETLPRAFIETLIEEAGPKGLKFSDYPDFALQAGYLILRYEIEPNALFGEIKKLFEQLLERGTKDEERRLVALFKDAELVRKLLNLELSREEWRTAQDRREELLPKKIFTRVKSLEPGTKNQELGSVIPAKAGIQSDYQKQILTAFDNAFSFYGFATKREAVFSEKIMSELEHTDRAILMTGGFHTDGLKSFFREKEISYGSLTPRIQEAPNANLYREVMMGRSSTSFHSATIEISSLLNAPQLDVATLTQKLAQLADVIFSIQTNDDRLVAIEQLKKVFLANGIQVEINVPEKSVKVSKEGRSLKVARSESRITDREFDAQVDVVASSGDSRLIMRALEKIEKSLDGKPARMYKKISPGENKRLFDRVLELATEQNYLLDKKYARLPGVSIPGVEGLIFRRTAVETLQAFIEAEAALLQIGGVPAGESLLANSNVFYAAAMFPERYPEHTVFWLGVLLGLIKANPALVTFENGEFLRRAFVDFEKQRNAASPVNALFYEGAAQKTWDALLKKFPKSEILSNIPDSASGPEAARSESRKPVSFLNILLTGTLAFGVMVFLNLGLKEWQRSGKGSWKNDYVSYHVASTNTAARAFMIFGMHDTLQRNEPFLSDVATLWQKFRAAHPGGNNEIVYFQEYSISPEDLIPGLRRKGLSPSSPEQVLELSNDVLQPVYESYIAGLDSSEFVDDFVLDPFSQGMGKFVGQIRKQFPGVKIVFEKTPFSVWRRLVSLDNLLPNELSFYQKYVQDGKLSPAWFENARSNLKAWRDVQRARDLAFSAILHEHEAANRFLFTLRGNRHWIDLDMFTGMVGLNTARFNVALFEAMIDRKIQDGQPVSDEELLAFVLSSSFGSDIANGTPEPKFYAELERELEAFLVHAVRLNERSVLESMVTAYFDAQQQMKTEQEAIRRDFEKLNYKAIENFSEEDLLAWEKLESRFFDLEFKVYYGGFDLVAAHGIFSPEQIQEFSRVSRESFIARQQELRGSFRHFIRNEEFLRALNQRSEARKVVFNAADKVDFLGMMRGNPEIIIADAQALGRYENFSDERHPIFKRYPQLNSLIEELVKNAKKSASLAAGIDRDKVQVSVSFYPDELGSLQGVLNIEINQNASRPQDLENLKTYAEGFRSVGPAYFEKREHAQAGGVNTGIGFERIGLLLKSFPARLKYIQDEKAPYPLITKLQIKLGRSESRLEIFVGKIRETLENIKGYIDSYLTTSDGIKGTVISFVWVSTLFSLLLTSVFWFVAANLPHFFLSAMSFKSFLALTSIWVPVALLAHELAHYGTAYFFWLRDGADPTKKANNFQKQMISFMGFNFDASMTVLLSGLYSVLSSMPSLAAFVGLGALVSFFHMMLSVNDFRNGVRVLMGKDPITISNYGKEVDVQNRSESRGTLLVLEDKEVQANKIKAAYSDYDIVWVRNVNAAMEAVASREKPFDLIISDLDLASTVFTKFSKLKIDGKFITKEYLGRFSDGQLPRLRLGGLAFVEWLLANNKAQKIIFNSTMFGDSESDRWLAKLTGADPQKIINRFKGHSIVTTQAKEVTFSRKPEMIKRERRVPVRLILTRRAGEKTLALTETQLKLGLEHRTILKLGRDNYTFAFAVFDVLNQLVREPQFDGVEFSGIFQRWKRHPHKLGELDQPFESENLTHDAMLTEILKNEIALFPSASGENYFIVAEIGKSPEEGGTPYAFANFLKHMKKDTETRAHRSEIRQAEASARVERVNRRVQEVFDRKLADEVELIFRNVALAGVLFQPVWVSIVTADVQLRFTSKNFMNLVGLDRVRHRISKAFRAAAKIVYETPSIQMNRGFVDRLSDPALAFVYGHELGHLLMSSGALLGVPDEILKILKKTKRTRNLSPDEKEKLQHYFQSQEIAADKIGVALVKRLYPEMSAPEIARSLATVFIEKAPFDDQSRLEKRLGIVVHPKAAERMHAAAEISVENAELLLQEAAQRSEDRVSPAQALRGLNLVIIQRGFDYLVEKDGRDGATPISVVKSYEAAQAMAQKLNEYLEPLGVLVHSDRDYINFQYEGDSSASSLGSVYVLSGGAVLNRVLQQAIQTAANRMDEEGVGEVDSDSDGTLRSEIRGALSIDSKQLAVTSIAASIGLIGIYAVLTAFFPVIAFWMFPVFAAVAPAMAVLGMRGWNKNLNLDKPGETTGTAGASQGTRRSEVRDGPAMYSRRGFFTLGGQSLAFVAATTVIAGVPGIVEAAVASQASKPKVKARPDAKTKAAIDVLIERARELSPEKIRKLAVDIENQDKRSSQQKMQEIDAVVQQHLLGLFPGDMVKRNPAAFQSFREISLAIIHQESGGLKSKIQRVEDEKQRNKLKPAFIAVGFSQVEAGPYSSKTAQDMISRYLGYPDTASKKWNEKMRQSMKHYLAKKLGLPGGSRDFEFLTEELVRVFGNEAQNKMGEILADLIIRDDEVDVFFAVTKIARQLSAKSKFREKDFAARLAQLSRKGNQDEYAFYETIYRGAGYSGRTVHPLTNDLQAVQSYLAKTSQPFLAISAPVVASTQPLTAKVAAVSHNPIQVSTVKVVRQIPQAGPAQVAVAAPQVPDIRISKPVRASLPVEEVPTAAVTPPQSMARAAEEIQPAVEPQPQALEVDEMDTDADLQEDDKIFWHDEERIADGLPPVLPSLLQGAISVVGEYDSMLRSDNPIEKWIAVIYLTSLLPFLVSAGIHFFAKKKTTSKLTVISGRYALWTTLFMAVGFGAIFVFKFVGLKLGFEMDMGNSEKTALGSIVLFAVFGIIYFAAKVEHHIYFGNSGFFRWLRGDRQDRQIQSERKRVARAARELRKLKRDARGRFASQDKSRRRSESRFEVLNLEPGETAIQLSEGGKWEKLSSLSRLTDKQVQAVSVGRPFLANFLSSSSTAIGLDLNLCTALLFVTSEAVYGRHSFFDETQQIEDDLAGFRTKRDNAPDTLAVLIGGTDYQGVSGVEEKREALLDKLKDKSIFKGHVLSIVPNQADSMVEAVFDPTTKILYLKATQRSRSESRHYEDSDFPQLARTMADPNQTPDVLAETIDAVKELVDRNPQRAYDEIVLPKTAESKLLFDLIFNYAIHQSVEEELILFVQNPTIRIAAVFAAQHFLRAEKTIVRNQQYRLATAENFVRAVSAWEVAPEHGLWISVLLKAMVDTYPGLMNQEHERLLSGLRRRFEEKRALEEQGGNAGNEYGKSIQYLDEILLTFSEIAGGARALPFDSAMEVRAADLATDTESVARELTETFGSQFPIGSSDFFNWVRHWTQAWTAGEQTVARARAELEEILSRQNDLGTALRAMSSYKRLRNVIDANPRVLRSEARQDGTGFDKAGEASPMSVPLPYLLSALFTKLGMRYLTRGSGLPQPERVIGLKALPSMENEYIFEILKEGLLGENDFRDFKEIAAKIADPENTEWFRSWVFKPNGQAGGVGIFFIEPQDDGTILIKMAYTPKFRPNHQKSRTWEPAIGYVEEKHAGQIQYPLHGEGMVRIILDGGKKRNAKSLYEIWRLIASQLGDAGMIESKMDLYHFVDPQGEKHAVETRFFMSIDLKEGNKVSLRKGPYNSDPAVLEPSYTRVGASGDMANVGPHGPIKTNVLYGNEMYAPLNVPQNQQEAFAAETEQKMREFANYVRLRLLALLGDEINKIPDDFRIHIEADAFWMKPSEPGGLPRLGINEVNLSAGDFVDDSFQFKTFSEMEAQFKAQYADSVAEKVVSRRSESHELARQLAIIEKLKGQVDATILPEQWESEVAAIRDGRVKARGEMVDVLNNDRERHVVTSLDRNYVHALGLLHYTDRAVALIPEGLVVIRRHPGHQEEYSFAIPGGHRMTGQTNATEEEIIQETLWSKVKQLMGKWAKLNEVLFKKRWATHYDDYEIRQNSVYVMSGEEAGLVREHVQEIRDQKASMSKAEFEALLEKQRKTKTGSGEAWSIEILTWEQLEEIRQKGSLRMRDVFKDGEMFDFDAKFTDPLIQDSEAMAKVKDILTGLNRSEARRKSDLSIFKNLWNERAVNYHELLRKKFFASIAKPAFLIPAGGADISLPLALNAETAVIPDLQLLGNKTDADRIDEVRIAGYFANKKLEGWGRSDTFTGILIPFVAQELKRLGVEDWTVEKIRDDRPVYRLRFQWAFPGEAPKPREFIFIGAVDLKNLESWNAYANEWKTYLPTGKTSFDGIIVKAQEYMLTYTHQFSYFNQDHYGSALTTLVPIMGPQTTVLTDVPFLLGDSLRFTEDADILAYEKEHYPSFGYGEDARQNSLGFVGKQYGAYIYQLRISSAEKVSVAPRSESRAWRFDPARKTYAVKISNLDRWTDPYGSKAIPETFSLSVVGPGHVETMDGFSSGLVFDIQDKAVRAVLRQSGHDIMFSRSIAGPEDLSGLLDQHERFKGNVLYRSDKAGAVLPSPQEVMKAMTSLNPDPGLLKFNEVIVDKTGATVVGGFFIVRPSPVNSVEHFEGFFREVAETDQHKRLHQIIEYLRQKHMPLILIPEPGATDQDVAYFKNGFMKVYSDFMDAGDRLVPRSEMRLTESYSKSDAQTGFDIDILKRSELRKISPSLVTAVLAGGILKVQSVLKDMFGLADVFAAPAQPKSFEVQTLEKLGMASHELGAVIEVFENAQGTAEKIKSAAEVLRANDHAVFAAVISGADTQALQNSYPDLAGRLKISQNFSEAQNFIRGKMAHASFADAAERMIVTGTVQALEKIKWDGVPARVLTYERGLGSAMDLARYGKTVQASQKLVGTGGQSVQALLGKLIETISLSGFPAWRFNTAELSKLAAQIALDIQALARITASA